MSKKIYLGTNTKMYKTIAQTVSFLTELERRTDDLSRGALTLFVIPSFTSLDAAHRAVSPQKILLGAQNMGWEEEGPFTGEISPPMLQEVGVRIAEIGHSERRHVLMETDEMENRRVLCALRNDLTPLLCVGETGGEKRLGLSTEVLRSQLKRGLYGVTPEQAERVWIAYEPVWAIGENGVPATEEYAACRHADIRALLEELFGREIARRIPVLYGGSVNNGNAAGLIRQENVDGLFIGRSAWDAENFEKIIRMVLRECA